MKKYIILLICLIFISGCSATYEIKITDKKIEEKLMLIETDKSLFDVPNSEGWTLRQMFESLLTTNSSEFAQKEYSVKSLTDGTQLGIQYYSDDSNEIINSSAIHQCYINPIMNEVDNIVTINTGDDFRCYEYYENLDSIKVILKTDYKVVSSNAHSVKNGKYIWNITKDGDKQIQFSYDKSDVKKYSIIIITVSIISFITVFCICYYIYYRMKEQNKV